MKFRMLTAKVTTEYQINKFIKILDGVMNDLLDNVSKNVKTNIRSSVPVDEGALRDATDIVKKNTTKTKQALIGTDVDKAPHGVYVFYGLPHGIKPKNKKVLHFFLKDGTEIFTKFVKPRPPVDYISPAYRKSVGDLPQLINNTLVQLGGV